jgi:cholinesterase
MKKNLRKKLLLIAIGITLFLSGCSIAYAEGYNNVIIFSGSLSDTGNFASVNGDLPAPYYQNRTTNGPNSVDAFASYFGFKADPSLHLTGVNSGNNYAVIASRAAGIGPSDLPAQLDAYFQKYGGIADPNTLYLMFIGGHEVREAVYEKDDAKAYKLLDDTIKGFKESLVRLIKAGGKVIYAPNFIDLSITPESRLTNVIERAHKISRYFNIRFEKMLDRVECKYGIDIARFDFEGFINNALIDATKLGFTNTTDACLPLLAQGQCDFDKFLFFTEVFPTARVHKLIGDAMAISFINRHYEESPPLCKKLRNIRESKSLCKSAFCKRNSRMKEKHYLMLLRR